MAGAPSFAAAIDPLLPQALHVARAVLGSRALLAEDAVQEALLRAYRAWPALPDKARDPWPWLKVIVLHECRRLAAREPAVTVPALAEPPGGGPDPLETVVAREARAEAAAALARLAAPYRTAAVLRYSHGLSCAEAAAVLGRPVGTVKWRLHEAHAQLRRALLAGPHGPPPGRPAAPEAAWEPAVPALRWTAGPVPAPLALAPGPWPPRTLEVPGPGRPCFAVPSRVGRRSPALWAATTAAHHLFWGTAAGIWRASGVHIKAVRAAAEGEAGNG